MQALGIDDRWKKHQNHQSVQSQSSVSRPSAVSILQVNNKTARLNEEELSRVLEQPEIGARPIVLVSIAGAFRKGKSFMLNFFIRYLRNEGWKNKSWMGDKTTKIEDGFHWRPGKEADTHGILLWSEVFIIDSNGCEVAVLLMDTQGLFDDTTSKTINAQIFALSTLLSSVQIVNISQQIQENDLEAMEFFTEYAKKTKDGDVNSQPFQKLMFLVRDWQHPNDNDFGLESGQVYLNEKLAISGRENKAGLISVRKSLRDSFGQIDCFLMPHPGKVVAGTKKGKQYDGRLEEIDEEFLEELNPLVDSILHPSKLTVKLIGGEKASSRPLMTLAKLCSDTFSSGKLPEVKNLLEATEDVVNMEAVQKCIDEYDRLMKEVKNSETYRTNEEYRAEHEKKKQAVFKIFDSKTGFGRQNKRQEKKEHLNHTLEQAFIKFQSMKNEEEANAKLKLETESVKIFDEYKKKMEKEMNGKSLVVPQLLNELHETYSHQALASFRFDGRISADECKQSKSRLEQQIAEFFKTQKKINDDKVKLEQDKQNEEKFLQRIKDYTKKYEATMKKNYGQKYIHPEDLKTQSAKLKEESIENFQKEMKNADPEFRRKKTEALKENLDNREEGIMGANNVNRYKEKDHYENLVKDIVDKTKKALEQQHDKFTPAQLDGVEEKLVNEANQEFQKNKGAQFFASTYRTKLETELKALIGRFKEEQKRLHDEHMEKITEEKLRKAVQDCSEEYDKMMGEICKGDIYLTEQDIEKHHKASENTAMSSFGNYTTNIGPEKSTRLRDSSTQLKEMMKKSYEIFHSKNETKRYKVERKLEDVVYRIAEEYERDIQKEFGGKEFLEPKDLADKHAAKKKAKMNTFDEETKKSANVSATYREKLQKRIDKYFAKLEKDNKETFEAHKKGEEDEYNARSIMNSCVRDYRESMATLTVTFCDPNKLYEGHNKMKRNAEGTFLDKSAKLHISSKIRGDFDGILSKKISEEFEDLKTKNGTNKSNVEKSLKQFKNKKLTEIKESVKETTFEREELKQFLEESQKNILQEFENQFKGLEMANEPRMSLKQELSQICAKRIKEDEEAHKIQLLRDAQSAMNRAKDVSLDEYREEMQGQFSTSPRELESKHRTAKNKVLRKFHKQVDKSACTESDKRDFSRDLTNAIDEEFKDIKTSNNETNEREFITMQKDVKSRIESYRTQIEQKFNTSRRMDHNELHRQLSDLSKRIVDDFRVSSMRNHQGFDTELTRLQRELQTISSERQNLNDRNLADLKKAEAKKQLNTLVECCASLHSNHLEKLANVFASEITLKSRHNTAQQEAMQKFQNESSHCEFNDFVTEYRILLEQRLVEQYQTAENRNQENESIVENQIEAAARAALTQYNEEMEKSLKRGYLVEEKFEEVHMEAASQAAKVVAKCVLKAEHSVVASYREKLEERIESKVEEEMQLHARNNKANHNLMKRGFHNLTAFAKRGARKLVKFFTG